MALSSGSRLGGYEIVAPIGAGGMGEVYRARDARLGREVAIKVLPEAVAQNPERLARFEREAKVLASLNHPNIAQIFGLEERALVMELVEGEMLKGPLDWETARSYAGQIAEALAAAHEKGIVHRDLKPANIMVTAAGVVKLLDFGLAKAAEFEGPAGGGGDLTNSPTMTMSPTMAGVVLGTAAYMSPEQARGKVVDKRADIWAFGVVFWEMLTGEQMFQGETVSDTLAGVLKEQPDLGRVPKQARRLLRSCLEKDPRNRLRDIGDVWKLLDEEQGPVAPAASVSEKKRNWWPWGIAAVATMVAAVALVTGIGKRAEVTSAPLVQLSLLPPEDARFTSVPAVSPDGQMIAFVATKDNVNRLYVRGLSWAVSKELPGTDGASYPFWSPDGQSLGFFAERKLKRIDLAGATPVTLADAEVGRGGSWSPSGVIVFAPGLFTGLMQVPAAGGAAKAATATADTGNGGHRAPYFLPDGDRFVFLARSTSEGKQGLYLGSLKGGKARFLVSTNSTAIAVRPGYLLYQQDRQLRVQRFSLESAEVQGEAIPFNGAEVGFDPLNLQGRVAASETGVLALLPPETLGTSGPVWLDAKGKVIGPLTARAVNATSTLSPDETRAATAISNLGTGGVDIWIHDVARGVESQVTQAGGRNRTPVWSPDGKQLAFIAYRDGRAWVVRQPASGEVSEERVAEIQSELPNLNEWTKDGRYLVGSYARGATGQDLWWLDLNGERKVKDLLRNEFNESGARVSPDGKWMAYISDETKRPEVYVQAFPGLGQKVQVSPDGASMACWKPDGRELYYWQNGLMMAVAVEGGSPLKVGAPRRLFEVGASTGGCEVTRDGRFLMRVAQAPTGRPPMTVILNWPQLLERR